MIQLTDGLSMALTLSGFPLSKLPRRFRARMNVQFLVNRMQMRAHCAQCDAKVLADFLVEITFREQRQDFQLALRQFLHLGRWLFDLLEVIHHFARDLHRHRRAAGMDLLDCLGQFAWVHVLEQVTTRPRAQ